MDKKPKYSLSKDGEFIIEGYNYSKPFANFFPGIAGKYGIPMWVFYVNRGQCISSFGVKDKDHAILEFWPANKSWSNVSFLGFRTFIKISSGTKSSLYEPFHNGSTNLEFKLSNRMRISSSELILEEENLSLGLSIKVKYFNIPNDSYAGLARIVTIKNLKSTSRKMQIIDGLPQIVPYGNNNFFLKNMSRTIEAWMNVENLNNGVPFYRLTVDPSDRPEVVHITEGNFYLGFHYDKNKPKIICPIVDPEYVFGAVTDFSYPGQFMQSKNFNPPKQECVRSKTPSALLLLNVNLAPKEEKAFYAVSGNMRNIQILNSAVKNIIVPGYLDKKAAENKNIIEELQADIDTKTSSSELNFYTRQTYLDNILRGGYPEIFKNKSANTIFYLYSRKHGDLERDYNKFQLQPTYFSQGNGNYRDINQNRRCDIWFNPEVKDDNLISFLNLIQTDGFNPLVIRGASFTLKDSETLKKKLTNFLNEPDIAAVISFLSKPFTPGDAIFFIEEKNIKLNCNYNEFVKTLLSCSEKNQEAEHSEGFWTDHWTYNLDLLENYFKVYPEDLEETLLHRKVFTFYDNTETIKPRSEKYVLHNGSPKQLHSVSSDPAKKELIRKRASQASIVRTQNGYGEIYYTTLLNKLLCLVVNKLASLDPSGCGIEMEADKPNWIDSLNGLPALFGSSLCETLELKRLLLFILGALKSSQAQKLNITEEIYTLLASLTGLIEKYYADNSPDRDFEYWDKSYALKEEYRQKIKLGLSGQELEIAASSLIGLLNIALKKVDDAVNKAKDSKKELYSSFFINEVKEYEIIKEPFIRPTKFIQKKLPLFLQGQMHSLRLTKDKLQAQQLYKATKESPLYDAKLKMYKLNAPLTGMPEEIGRSAIFPRGWLENESVFLHMEYKYILELLKAGLHEEFYNEFKNVVVAFLKPQVYGRSILENSSFIVSSAFPDKKLHGNGFVARLSGSTAEFLNMWLLMNVGVKGFSIDANKKLNLTFEPILAGWLFDKKGFYSFNFLSKTRVVYHNPKRKNTFGRNAAKINKIIFNDNSGSLVEIQQETVPSPYAEQIRARQIRQIDIYLE